MSYLRFPLMLAFATIGMGCGVQPERTASNTPSAPLGDASLQTAIVFSDLTLFATPDEWYKEIQAEDAKDFLAFLAEDIGFVEGDRFAVILPRKTPIPVRRSEVFTTSVDNQSILRMALHYRPHQRPGHLELIGVVEVIELPSGRAGQPRIEISVGVGWRHPEPIQSKITVTAKDCATGEALQLRRVR